MVEDFRLRSKDFPFDMTREDADRPVDFLLRYLFRTKFFCFQRKLFISIYPKCVLIRIDQKVFLNFEYRRQIEDQCLT